MGLEFEHNHHPININSSGLQPLQIVLHEPSYLLIYIQPISSHRGWNCRCSNVSKPSSLKVWDLSGPREVSWGHPVLHKLCGISLEHSREHAYEILWGVQVNVLPKMLLIWSISRVQSWGQTYCILTEVQF
jgi:hypothetical protein